MKKINNIVSKLIFNILTKVYSLIVRKRIPNISGDRDIEWSWVSSQIPNGPGSALDFGPGGSNLGLVAAQKGYQVKAVDLEPMQWLFKHPNIQFIQGNILDVELPQSFFDLVINCSTIEHVGLSGRYGNNENNTDGDLIAMTKLASLMKPAGIMLLTVPAGQDIVYESLHRIYGTTRLSKLLKGFTVIKDSYWVKDDSNLWEITSKDEAIKYSSDAGSWNPLRNIYALACFVLMKEG